MKRIFLLLTALFLWLSLISCDEPANEQTATGEQSKASAVGTASPTTSRTECTETLLLHVQYVGEDGFIGEYVQADGECVGVLVLCDPVDLCVSDSVHVEAAESKILEESGERTLTAGPLAGETVGYSRVIREPLSVCCLQPDLPVPEKPVIYLYPKSQTQVSVKLAFDGKLLVTDPDYGEGWTVTASPDGRLTTADGKTYPYLFWEGQMSDGLALTEGFCIPGSETQAFLREMLPKLGLIPAEYEEFMEYWLPRMEGNAYNLIRFCGEDYTDRAKLTVNPQPDSVIRVFMAYRGCDEFVDIPAQIIETPVREGFVLVEWGGCQLSK